MSAVTLLVPYSSAGQENAGVKIEVPGQSVDPGEAFRIYLWGRDAAALAGYSLTQGSDGLGAGTVRQYPGQTDAELFDLDGTGGFKDFNWPVLSLSSVVAVGQCFVIDGNDVSLYALAGEDVTRLFRLSGNALAPVVGAPKLCGTVRATAARSPWCREWHWTTPATPAHGLPAGTCDSGDKDRDAADYWFFLLRWGVLSDEFSLSLAASETYVDVDYLEELEEEEESPVSSNDCAWAADDLDTLFDVALGLECFVRACAIEGVVLGSALSSVADESGAGNDFANDDGQSPTLGSNVIRMAPGAQLALRNASSFPDKTWTWFFVFDLSSVTGSIVLRVFSFRMALVPSPGNEWINYGAAIYNGDNRSSGMSGSLENIVVNDFLSPVILTVQGGLDSDGLYWMSRFWVNGSLMSEFGTGQQFFEDSSRDVTILSKDDSGEAVLELRNVLGFNQVLTDDARQKIEAVLRKYNGSIV